MIIMDVLPFHFFCSWGRLFALKLASGGYDYFNCKWSSYSTVNQKVDADKVFLLLVTISLVQKWAELFYYLLGRLTWKILFKDLIIKMLNLLKYYPWCAIYNSRYLFIKNIHAYARAWFLIQDFENQTFSFLPPLLLLPQPPPKCYLLPLSAVVFFLVNRAFVTK